MHNYKIRSSININASLTTDTDGRMHHYKKPALTRGFLPLSPQVLS